MFTPRYIYHWFHLQAVDFCLWIYSVTGYVFQPEELFGLLLVCAATLGVLMFAIQTWAERREAGRTDLI
jgi:hypothetical protein